MFGDPFTNEKEWVIEPLSKHMIDANNGMTRRGNDENGSIVLRLVELQKGFIDYSNPNRINPTDKESTKCTAEVGDFLFARVNGNPNNVGRCAVFKGYSEPVLFNDHIIRVKFDSNLGSTYLSTLLNGEYGRNQFKDKIKTSAGQYTVSQDGISSIIIPVPPISLQNQYEQFVEQVDKSKFIYERMISELNFIVKSRFIEMFGSVVRNEKCLPESSLIDVCISIVDGSHNPSKGGNRSKYLMLSSKNIVNNEITYEDPRYLSKEDFEIENKRTKVKTGDILMTIVGTIGRTAIVPEDHGYLTFQRSVAILHVDTSKVVPTFLKYCVDQVQQDIENQARGSSQKGIYLNQVKKIKVLVPSLVLQKQFAAFVEQVDKLKSILTKRLEMNFNYHC